MSNLYQRSIKKNIFIFFIFVWATLVAWCKNANTERQRKSERRQYMPWRKCNVLPIIRGGGGGVVCRDFVRLRVVLQVFSVSLRCETNERKKPLFFLRRKAIFASLRNRNSASYSQCHSYNSGTFVRCFPKSIATLPLFGPMLEGHKWFDQISSQWESQKNRFAFISFDKIQFLPPCFWNLPFMSYRLKGQSHELLTLKNVEGRER